MNGRLLFSMKFPWCINVPLAAIKLRELIGVGWVERERSPTKSSTWLRRCRASLPKKLTICAMLYQASLRGTKQSREQSFEPLDCFVPRNDATCKFISSVGTEGTWVLATTKSGRFYTNCDVHCGCLYRRFWGLVLSLLVALSQAAYSQETSTIPGAPTAKSSPTIMRDPTKPFTGKVEVSGQLQLRSILIGKDRRLALINDTFVEIGDTIGSAKVIAIKEYSVVLVDSGRTETLYLFTNDIRK